MRAILKNIMRRNPAIFNPLWAFLYPLMIRRDGKYFGWEYLNRQQAFQTIFEENRWDSSESRRSGCRAPHFGVLKDIMTTDQKIIGAKVGAAENRGSSCPSAIDRPPRKHRC
jgi:hypothetical protein